MATEMSDVPVMVSASEVAEWLRDIGYGVDFSSPDHPLPESLRRPLAEAWLRYENASDLTVEDYEQMLDAEGAW